MGDMSELTCWRGRLSRSGDTGERGVCVRVFSVVDVARQHCIQLRRLCSANVVLVSGNPGAHRSRCRHRTVCLRGNICCDLSRCLSGCTDRKSASCDYISKPCLSIDNLHQPPSRACRNALVLAHVFCSPRKRLWIWKSPTCIASMKELLITTMAFKGILPRGRI